MMLTVIMHFYNEELLLPFWLKHHTKIFDHGVLIDYASTDASNEICRELAPHWELIQSRNPSFQASEVDAEVMEHERRFPGWKMALNTTEFVLAEDLSSYCEDFESKNPNSLGFTSSGVFAIDPPQLVGVPLTAEPLLYQRHWGYFAPSHGRNRLIHRAETGSYTLGRHNTHHENIKSFWQPEVYNVWYGWSPWPQVKERKLHVKDRIPQSDKDMGLGIEHQMTPEEMDLTFESYSQRAHDLRDDEVFARVWRNSMKMLHGMPVSDQN